MTADSRKIPDEERENYPEYVEVNPYCPHPICGREPGHAGVHVMYRYRLVDNKSVIVPSAYAVRDPAD